jgi:ABC-2 type transport system permease protein
MSVRPFTALVRKDVRVFLSDRRAVILSFIAPLALAAIFASIGGGGGQPRSKIPLLVVDDDQSKLSREMVEGLSADKNLAVTEVNLTDARRKVATGDVGVAVAIPKGFGASAGKGFFLPADDRKPELTFLVDPTHAAESGMVRGLLTQQAMQTVSRDAFSGPGGLVALDDAQKRLDEEGNIPDALRDSLRLMFRDIRRVRDQAAEAEQADDPGDRKSAGDRANSGPGYSFATPFTVREELVAARGQADQGIAAAHAFAGMAVQFILFASVEGGVGLLYERQKGLWRRLRAAPVTRWVLLGSKAVSQALIALLITVVMFAFGVGLFHVRFSGSLAGFVLVSIAYALTASTFGLLIAALGKTPQAARGISVMAVLLMVLLGGAWIPMFLFPDWLQEATLLIPTRWAVDGLEGATWRGLGLAALAPKAAALLGFSALFGGLAAVRFRWEEE